MQTSDLQRIVGINHPHEVEHASREELLKLALSVDITDAAHVTSPEIVQELITELSEA